MDRISCTKALTSRLKDGDEEAFKQIYERFWEKLYQVSYYYTHSKEDSEDILINIFMAVWNNREKIEIEYMESYLVKAVKNQSLKYIIKQQRVREHIRKLEENALKSTTAADSPEIQLEIKELSRHLDNQVQSLPEKTKTIFLLNRENGLTYEQIAHSLGVSVKTVEYHISKALAVLSRYVIIIVMILLIS